MAENVAQPNNTKKKEKTYKFWKPDNYDSRRVHARWDSNNTEIFLQACVTQIRSGNRASHYLNNKGWDGVLETFYNKTKIYYDQNQLRNRWDILKQEYVAWIAVLKGATGLGWNAAKGTWDAPDHWWDEMAKKYKAAKKFKDKGLEHTDLIEVLFGGRTATGECQWTPAEDLPSNIAENQVNSENVYMPVIDDDIRDDEQHDSIPEPNISTQEPNISTQEPNVESSGERDQRGTSQPPNETSARATKRRRVSSATLISNSLERAIEAVENQSGEVVIKQYADQCNATVENCLQKLDQLPELVIGSPLYLLGVDLMSVPGNREIFWKMRTDEIRLGWLQEKFAYRNALMSLSFPFSFNGGGSSFNGGGSAI